MTERVEMGKEALRWAYERDPDEQISFGRLIIQVKTGSPASDLVRAATRLAALGAHEINIVKPLSLPFRKISICTVRR